MIIVKSVLDRIERVYSTALVGDPPSGLLVASEGYGECKYFSLPGLQSSIVEDNPGGTTDLCVHPQRDDLFFAISRFVPVFDAAEAELTYVSREVDGAWRMHPIRRIPYLHRFDIFVAHGTLHFVGATLCSAKSERDDWSSPGAVVTGTLDPQTYALSDLTVLVDGLCRNHGFIKTRFDGRESYLISADNGIWVIPIPTDPDGGWKPYRLLDSPASDVAVCDIDGDGVDELAVIAPFHGDAFTILKRVEERWEAVYSRAIEFGHVLWGGSVNGVPSFLLGYRKDDMKLLLLRSDAGRTIRETCIDAGGGPSQISVFQNPCSFTVLAANRATGIVDGEAALSTVHETGEVLT